MRTRKSGSRIGRCFRLDRREALLRSRRFGSTTTPNRSRPVDTSSGGVPRSALLKIGTDAHRHELVRPDPRLELCSAMLFGKLGPRERTAGNWSTVPEGTKLEVDAFMIRPRRPRGNSALDDERLTIDPKGRC